MKKILFAFSMLAFAGGCGGNEMDDAISKMGGFVDKMCACKDMACVEAVKKDQDAYEEKMKDKFKGKDKKPSEAQMAKIMKIMTKAEGCMAKLKPADGDAPPAPTP